MLRCIQAPRGERATPRWTGAGRGGPVPAKGPSGDRNESVASGHVAPGVHLAGAHPGHVSWACRHQTTTHRHNKVTPCNQAARDYQAEFIDVSGSGKVDPPGHGRISASRARRTGPPQLESRGTRVSRLASGRHANLAGAHGDVPSPADTCSQACPPTGCRCSPRARCRSSPQLVTSVPYHGRHSWPPWVCPASRRS